jgi:hypothetical protein
MTRKFRYIPIPETGGFEFINRYDVEGARASVGNGNYDSDYDFVDLGSTFDDTNGYKRFIGAYPAASPITASPNSDFQITLGANNAGEGGGDVVINFEAGNTYGDTVTITQLLDIGSNQLVLNSADGFAVSLPEGEVLFDNQLTMTRNIVREFIWGGSKWRLYNRN